MKLPAKLQLVAAAALGVMAWNLASSTQATQADPKPPVAPAVPTAAAVAAGVQTYYAKQTQLTADFTQTVTNTTFNASKTTTGIVHLQRPNKMHWDYNPNTKGKAHKEFLVDGTTLWVIDHANLQVIKSAIGNNAALPAAVAFLNNTGPLTNDFTVGLTTTSGFGGKTASVLELVPKLANAQVKKLVLVVDPATGRVDESIVVSPSNDTNAFEFANPTTAKIAATVFVFDPALFTTYKITTVPPTP